MYRDLQHWGHFRGRLKWDHVKWKVCFYHRWKYRSANLLESLSLQCAPGTRERGTYPSPLPQASYLPFRFSVLIIERKLMDRMNRMRSQHAEHWIQLVIRILQVFGGANSIPFVKRDALFARESLLNASSRGIQVLSVQARLYTWRAIPYPVPCSTPTICKENLVILRR